MTGLVLAFLVLTSAFNTYAYADAGRPWNAAAAVACALCALVLAILVTRDE